jgi:hypothetical protein
MDLFSDKLVVWEHLKDNPFIVQVMNYGRVEGARDCIITVLEVRLGKRRVSRLVKAIREIEDLARLEKLLLPAARCSNPEEFQEALAQRAPAVPESHQDSPTDHRTVSRRKRAKP